MKDDSYFSWNNIAKYLDTIYRGKYILLIMKGSETMKYRNLFIIAVVIIALVLTSCSPASNSNLEEELKAKDDLIKTLEDEKKSLEDEVEALKDRVKELEEQSVQRPQSLLSTALQVVEILKNEDMTALAAYVHPTSGVRFTPYSYVDTASDLTFTQDQVAALMSDNTIRTWGAYDGSGEPIDKTFSDYYDEFVYDEDYLNPHMIGNNVLIGKGNSLDNLTDVYTNGEFVEFHFSGFDPQYEGIDWSSLKLVFEQVSGEWKLVGIIHSQWTI